MRRSSISSRPKTSPLLSAAPAPVLLRTPSTLPTPPAQAVGVIVTLIATVTVTVVVAVILMVVVAARSLMLVHGWMAAQYVVRAGYAGRFPSLAPFGPRCGSRKIRRSWSRRVMLSRRYERMKRRKRLRLAKLTRELQAPASALLPLLPHHHPRPRAVARPQSDSHRSRIHHLQPLCVLLSDVTEGAGGKRRVCSFDLLFDGAFSFRFILSLHFVCCVSLHPFEGVAGGCWAAVLFVLFRLVSEPFSPVQYSISIPERHQLHHDTFTFTFPPIIEIDARTHNTI